MTTNELAAKLAEQECVSEAEAAAHLDELARRIHRLVREGQRVELPGLGRFEPGQPLQFRFDHKQPGPTAGARHAAGKRRG
ncbi:MAG: HU family DNA-binding protein [Acidobacteriota bacterium]